MQLSFRQGLVQYQSNFLAWGSTGNDSITLSTTNKPTIVTFSQGPAEYLFVEPTGQNANVKWTNLPVTFGQDFWIYWDVDTVTSLISYGFTTSIPAFGPVDPFLTTIPFPTTPATGQMWFDTSMMIMRVWNGTSWTPKIRAFAAKIENGSVIVPYPAGTQVGVGASIKSGRILRDESGLPVKKANKTFITSEDKFFIENSDVKTSELETSIVVGRALESIPMFTAVKLVGFDDYSLAAYEDTASGFIGMAIDSATYGESFFVTIQGLITNPAWNWQTPNAQLWIDTNGELTENNPGITTPARGSQQPIARVISPTSILFGQGYFNEAGIVSNAVVVRNASNSTIGISRLTLDPVTSSDPIAVGDNDPRMSDARIPLPHTHASTDVIYLGNPLDTTLGQFATDISGKVNKSGDTMTGSLVLSGDPTTNLESATKQYVDNSISAIPVVDISGKVNKAGDTMTGLLVLSGDPTSSLNAATKQYVDNAPNQTIMLSGDVSGSGTDTISTTLATVVTAGTYNNSSMMNTPLTFDAKGRLVGVGTPLNITPNWGSILGTPTSLFGYGITDAQPLNADLTAIANLPTGDTGILTKTGAGTWTLAASSSGATNTIYQGDSSLTVTDTGSNGLLTLVVDGKSSMTIDTTHATFVSGVDDSWVSVVQAGLINSTYSGGSSVQIDSLGNVITVGGADIGSGFTGGLIVKIDPTGNTIWQHIINDVSGSGSQTFGDACIIDSTDAIIATLDVNSGNSITQPVVKIDTNGSILWQTGIKQNIDPSNSAYEPHITDIAVDTVNDIYMVGNLLVPNPDIPSGVIQVGILIKLAGADGSMIWQQVIEDATTASPAGKQNINLTGITFNSTTNELYVCGNINTYNGTNSSLNGLVSAFDLNGVRQWISVSGVSGDATQIIDQSIDPYGNAININHYGITTGVGSTQHNSGGISVYVCGSGTNSVDLNERFCVTEYIAVPGSGIASVSGDLVTLSTFNNSYGTYGNLYEIVATATELIAVGNPSTSQFGTDWALLKIGLPSLTLAWSSTIGFAANDLVWWNNSNRCLDVRNGAIAVAGLTYQHGGTLTGEQMMTIRIPILSPTFSTGNCSSGISN